MSEFSSSRADGMVRVECRGCGRFIIQRDKGLGRAHIAAWKTRHQHEPTTTPATDPTQGASDE